MVFVADEIPPELRRIVEFLNAHTDPVEVLAVEIKQYVGQGLHILVPKVVGQTAEAQAKKGATVRATRQWDEPSFIAELHSNHDDDAVQVAEKIIEWAYERKLRPKWGTGPQDGSFRPMLDHNGEQHWLITLWTYARLNIQFQQMATKPPFADEKLRMELLRKLNEISGISLPPDSIGRMPAFSITVLGNDAALEQFIDVLDWMIKQIKLA